MNVVVTGSSGHVGINLVRALLANGDSVRALVHVSDAALQDLPVEVARADVRQSSTLRGRFSDAEVVYHVAAQISVSRRDSACTWDVNVEGVRNVVQECLASGVRRLVHFSSIHAIVSPRDGATVDEYTPLADAESYPPYDRSKARGELLALEAGRAGLEVVVVAPTAVVGPYDYRPSYFGRVLLAMARKRMPAKVGGGFDWVDVRDVAAGAITAAHQGRPGCKYLLSGHWRSLAEVADLIAEAVGTRAPVVHVPLAAARACSPVAEYLCRAAGWTPLFTPYSVDALRNHRVVSHDRASVELNYSPRSLENTIVDTCRWFSEHGYLPGATLHGART